MARAGLNKFNVQQARDALRARGINPSVDAVRIELGNTGSKTTIHRHLKELELEESAQLDDETLLSNTLKEMVGRLAARLREEAAQLIADAESRFQAEKSQLAERIATLQAALTTTSQAKTEFEQRLTVECTSHQATQELLNLSRIKAERLAQQASDLTTQLADQQKHVASLEEKHRHARDALEHFRTAAKEQREQEQLRHATQLQQVQAELRSTQQTLVIKHSELTQLNRDNAGFVSELSAARKQLAQLEKSQTDVVQQSVRLNETETQLAAFTVEKTAWETQYQALWESLEAEKQKTQTQELKLAKLETELAVKNEWFERFSVPRETQ